MYTCDFSGTDTQYHIHVNHLRVPRVLPFVFGSRSLAAESTPPSFPPRGRWERETPDIGAMERETVVLFTAEGDCQTGVASSRLRATDDLDLLILLGLSLPELCVIGIAGRGSGKQASTLIPL